MGESRTLTKKLPIEEERRGEVRSEVRGEVRSLERHPKQKVTLPHSSKKIPCCLSVCGVVVVCGNRECSWLWPDSLDLGN
jgi:hypothetical protein